RRRGPSTLVPQRGQKAKVPSYSSENPQRFSNPNFPKNVIQKCGFENDDPKLKFPSVSKKAINMTGFKTKTGAQRIALSRRARSFEGGFSMLESVATVGVVLTMLAMVVPKIVTATKTYKASGAARVIASQLSLARMRAAANFTQARLNVNVNAGTYSVDI